jgi:hypothetical protein
MNIDPFIIDEQDPKTVEKVLGKISDMLTPGEKVIYLAVQKKPAVTLIPDSIVVTDKRIVFCIPGNLGLTTNFEIFSWKDVKEVSFKEEFFGAKFTAVPLSGENFTVDYIPKVQARKLYQYCNQQLESFKNLERERAEEKERSALAQQQILDKKPPVEEISQSIPAGPSVVVPEVVAALEDELTQKLQKLKGLFERGLITQDEYEAKKVDILSQL